MADFIIPKIEQPNFLQSIGGAAQVGNALLQNQAQRQQIQANLATSDAFKQATNPETGQTDWNQLRGLIAGGPAAYNLPQINQAITQNQVSQQQLEAGRFDLAMKKQGAIADQLGSLVNLGPNLKKDDIVNKVTELVQNGILPLDQGIQQLGSMPSDPAGMQAWVKQHAFTALKGMERMQAMNPQVMAVNNGAGTTLINTNMMSSAPYGVIGEVKQQLSPAQLAEPKTILGENGEPRQVTTAEWLQMQGQGGGGGGAPSGYTGRYGAPQGQPQGAPGVQTGLSPEAQTARAAKGTAAAALASQGASNAETAPNRISILRQAQAALSNKEIQTGPNSDWRNTAKSFLTGMAPDTAKALGTADNVKDYDEFVKLMNQYANQASANMGTGTNDRLNIALMGNANPHISKMANQDILSKTIAVERMNQAKNYAWQQSGAPPEKYQEWSSQWNKAVDPAVYIFDELNDAQRQKFVSTMNEKQLNSFKRAYNVAKHNGLLE